jgi:hypothetical protein
MALLETVAGGVMCGVMGLLRVLELARLCASSPELYRRFSPRAAPHIWRLLRPSLAQRLRILTTAPLAEAQRLHSIYDCVIRRQFPETFSAPSFVTPDLVIETTMPAWMYAYYTTIRGACMQGAMDKIRWVHALYSEYASEFVVSAQSATFKQPRRTAVITAVQSLVCTACAAGHVEAARWVMDTLDPERFASLSIGFVRGLIKTAVWRTQLDSMRWVLDYFAPARATVAQALLGCASDDPGHAAVVAAGHAWLEKTA